MWPQNDETKRRTPSPNRIYLKIKIRSLAAEAAIIRAEERKWPGGGDHRTGLHRHRVIDVRREARSASLAYGFLRGRAYRQIEAKAYEKPDWKNIEEIAKRFGDGHHKDDFAAWRKAAEAA